MCGARRNLRRNALVCSIVFGLFFLDLTRLLSQASRLKKAKACLMSKKNLSKRKRKS